MTFEKVDQTFDYSLRGFCRAAIRDTDVSVILMHKQRWADIRDSSVDREDDLKLEYPALLYTRTGEEERMDYRPFNEHADVVVHEEWSVDNPYDSYSLDNDIRPVKKYTMVMFPKYYSIRYECTFISTHTSDVNNLKATLTMNNPSYWGIRKIESDDADYLILAKVGGFTNQPSGSNGEDRLVRTNFTVEIVAPILPDSTHIGQTQKILKGVSRVAVITETTPNLDNTNQ